MPAHGTVPDELEQRRFRASRQAEMAILASFVSTAMPSRTGRHARGGTGAAPTRRAGCALGQLLLESRAPSLALAHFERAAEITLQGPANFWAIL